MNTNGAVAQSTGPCPAPPAHNTLDTAPVDGSTVADTTFREKYAAIGKPTRFACPAVVMIDGRPPRLMILLWAVAKLPVMSHPKFGILSSCSVAWSSMPWLFTWPRFWNCVPVNPSDGATGCATISSVVCLLKYVKSRCRRSQRSDSNPASSSFPRSGFKFELPKPPAVNALVPPGPCTGRYDLSAENASGARPDSPYAARSLSELTNARCQNGSSLTIHEALTLGYVIHLNCVPNALLLSTRSAPVRNNRSLRPISSCP